MSARQLFCLHLVRINDAFPATIQINVSDYRIDVFYRFADEPRERSECDVVVVGAADSAPHCSWILPLLL